MKTVFQISLFIGLLPSLAIIGVMLLALEHGARGWPDVGAAVVFGGLYLVFIAAGAWLFSRLRY
jgi:hypothetical protein